MLSYILGWILLLSAAAAWFWLLKEGKESLKWRILELLILFSASVAFAGTPIC